MTTASLIWDAADATRSSLTDHRDAIAWLRSPLAAALRSHVEVDQAAAWNPDLTPPPARLAAWLTHAYDITSTTPDSSFASVAEMPMTAQWLTDRADRLSGAEQLVASPAAVAVAVAAAQTLGGPDLDLLTSRAASLPFPHAHLTLSAPVAVTATEDDETGDVIHALSWWPTTDGIRVADWISTRDTLTDSEADQALAASHAYGTMLPELMLDTERLHRHVEAAPVPDDPIPSEAEFRFDVPVYDPDRRLAFSRLGLVVRHLVGAGVLHAEVERVRPRGASGHVTRTPVTVLRAADDVGLTGRLVVPGTAVVIRRHRGGRDLQWSEPVVDGSQCSWSAPTVCSSE